MSESTTMFSFLSANTRQLLCLQFTSTANITVTLLTFRMVTDQKSLHRGLLHDTIRYINVRLKADEMASLV